MNNLNFEIQNASTSFEVMLPDLSQKISISISHVDVSKNEIEDVHVSATYKDNPIRFSYTNKHGFGDDLICKSVRMFNAIIKYL